MLYPEMFGEPLAFHDKVTVCAGAATPVPLAVPVSVEGCALLVNVRVALAAPATWGLYITLKGALVPAAMVAGSERPLIVKGELLETAAVTVTLAPMALSVPDAVPLNPTNTFPAAKVAGDTFN
jgi:hypothetical protein